MIFTASHIKVNGGNAWQTDTGILCVMPTGRKICSISKETGWPSVTEIIEIADKLLQTKTFAMLINQDENQINIIKK